MGANAQRRATARKAKERPLGLHPGTGQTWPGYRALNETGARLRETWDLAMTMQAIREQEEREQAVADGAIPLTGSARRRAKAVRNAGQAAGDNRLALADQDGYSRA